MSFDICPKVIWLQASLIPGLPEEKDKTHKSGKLFFLRLDSDHQLAAGLLPLCHIFIANEI
jgi:hypothetical protein